MPTEILGVVFEYSHTIGRAEFSGPGFRNPSAMVRGEGDLMYVVSRCHEAQPTGRRVTICTVGEEYIGEFGRGIPSEQEVELADGDVLWPTAIALDSKGNVYLADEWFNRISIFSKDGEWIGKWGTAGSSGGQINRPSGLAFDRDDNLFLVDSLNNRVQIFTTGGKFLSKWGKPGSGDGEFNMPWGITIDQRGEVYVADWRNNRIQKFTPDGQFLMKLGTEGSGDGEFKRPTGVGVDRVGLIYVADWGNNRAQVFDRDGGFIAKITGDATISKWGKAKVDANPYMWAERDKAQGLYREKLLQAPVAVVVDNQDRVFIVESGRPRIQIYHKKSPIFVGPRL